MIKIIKHFCYRLYPLTERSPYLQIFFSRYCATVIFNKQKMKISYILFTTFVILKATESLENANNKTQWTLLRKLQSYSEVKPLAWNEVMADILVNRIIPFSKQKDSVIKEGTVVEEKGFLTDFLSSAFAVFKKFIYDPYIRPNKYYYDVIDPANNTNSTTEHEKEPEAKVKTREVPLGDGPKGEVEIIEPKYHGKITENTDTKEDPVEEDSTAPCPEGTVVEGSNCANSSKLLISVPRQCPLGYRRDRLGFCRMMF